MFSLLTDPFVPTAILGEKLYLLFSHVSVHFYNSFHPYNCTILHTGTLSNTHTHTIPLAYRHIYIHLRPRPLCKWGCFSWCFGVSSVFDFGWWFSEDGFFISINCLLLPPLLSLSSLPSPPHMHTQRQNTHHHELSVSLRRAQIQDCT